MVVRKSSLKKKTARSVRPRRKVKFSRAKTYKRVYPKFSSIPALPSVKTVILPYHMEYITSVGNVITYQTFNSFNCHDPDYTGSGHQPRGWDQWKALYKYYRVLSCSIRAVFFWEETPSQSHTCGIFIDDDATFGYTGTNDLFEKCGKNTRTLTSDRTSKVILRTYVNMFKSTNKALRTSRTPVGSSPTETAPYIHVWSIANNTASLTYGAVRVHVGLHYKVQLFEPIDILGS